MVIVLLLWWPQHFYIYLFLFFTAVDLWHTEHAAVLLACLSASCPQWNILLHRHILAQTHGFKHFWWTNQREMPYFWAVFRDGCRYFPPTCLTWGHSSPSPAAICITPPRWPAWSINTPKNQTLMSNWQIRRHVLMLIYDSLSLCFQRNNAWNRFIQ